MTRIHKFLWHVTTLKQRDDCNKINKYTLVRDTKTTIL